MTVKLPELLVPAGDISKIKVALAYGADAIYIGASDFSMRPNSSAFGLPELQEATRLVHEQNKRLYVAVNSLILQDDLDPLERWLKETANVPFDALIIADPAALMLAREHQPNREIHISTQMSTANTQAAKFWKQSGASRVIMARECTLEQASQVSKEADIGVEVFAHGAMCVAVSGRCLLSAYMCGSSASKGQCKHSCRWDFQIVEENRPGHVFPVYQENGQTIILGSTDLCLIEHIPELVQGEYASLKIEGRMKNEHYVAVITSVYRAALDAYAKDPDNYVFNPQWLEMLNSLHHRPYATGFAFGYPFTEPTSLQTQDHVKGTHVIVGKVLESKDNRLKIHVKHPFAPGDIIEWMAPGLAQGSIEVSEIFNENGLSLPKTVASQTVTVEISPNSDMPPVQGILRRPQKS